MAKKLTIADIRQLKGKRQLTEVFTTDAQEAAACDAAGIDMIVTPTAAVKTIRAAAPNVFLTGGMVGDFGASEQRCIESAYAAMGDGADAVYTNASIERVAQMAREWVPVVGHVGFVPYRSSWLGGNRAIGKTAEEARRVYDDTKRYEDAGAIGVEMEVVPHQIATEIAKRTSIMIISMGAGSGADAPYLFATDILGTNTGHVPRHGKTYRNLAAEYDRLQQERIAAFGEFKQDVDSGAYPEPKHVVEADPAQHKRFLEMIE